MTAEAATEQGAWVQTTEPIPAGARFRHYHDDSASRNFDAFAYEGTMIDWTLRQWRMDVPRTYTGYGVGQVAVIDCHQHQLEAGHYALWVPAEVPATPTDSAYDGTPGAFEPHNGQIPESGTVVRAMYHGAGSRQVEGLFLRMNSADPTYAWVDAKRRRTKRVDGTFSEWESYSTRAERSVVVEGAEVFKPGATAKPTWARTRAITSSARDRRATVGQIISAPEGEAGGPLSRGRNATKYYRGEVVDAHGYDGPYTILATEECDLSSAQRRMTAEPYEWRPLAEPRRVMVYAVFSSGVDGFADAGWVWEKNEPGIKRVDPAFDPNRKTTHTGLGIDDLVVGLMRDAYHGRDTVSSWAKGVIFKWDTRYNRPIIKITDPMESDKKVGDEVTLDAEDVYPAMADPASVSPEEYKKTLRAYLIGRHKRGDFCRGGLNTMLAAHGIPLYETRRRAKMVLTVDYDPNTTDLYAVSQSLRRGLTGVSGLSFDERSGEDIELAVESDQTAG